MIGTGKERCEALDRLYPVWEPHTLWSRFAVNAEKYAGRYFLICQDDLYTYQEMKEKADQAARSFYALGVRPGDHVAVFLYNGPVFLWITFALAKLGAVKIPVNMKLGTEEKLFVLKQSDASWAVGTRLPLEEVSDELPKLQGIVKLEQWDQFMSLGETVEEAVIERLEREHRDPQAVCDIMYTSGSTSFPKGVMLTHDMLLRSSFGTCRTRRMEDGRRLFIPIPFYHIFAYSEGILAMLHVGGTIVASDRKFEPENALELMKRHQVNDMICVPIVMINLLKKGNPRPEDFPKMHAGYWASTCPDWVWDAAKKAFGILDVTTGYGMTECGSTTTMLSPEDDPEAVKTYVGRLKDAGAAGRGERDTKGRLLELKICDPKTEEELPAGTCGEIWCRGYTVTPGYYSNEEANRASFREGGWFKTGDLGIMDEQGMLVFCGRKGDMYKINGENVSPQYLDSVIGRCPDVEEVEVVGVPHERYGEVGVAFIDAGEANEEKKQRIEAYCRQKLARFQVPKYFFYGSNRDWPRTASGKVQKAKLRIRAEELLRV